MIKIHDWGCALAHVKGRVVIIDIAEARRRLRKSGFIAVDSSPGRGPGPVDSKRIEIERLIYESLKFLSHVGGPEAVDRVGERLILQIASRVTADCGRGRVLEMLEAIAAATVEVYPGPAWGE